MEKRRQEQNRERERERERDASGHRVWIGISARLAQTRASHLSELDTLARVRNERARIHAVAPLPYPPR